MSLRDPNRSLWAATAPPAPDAPPLRGDARCDVAVVGGGYLGLSAALRLAEKGASVALLEAHEIGHGGSGRNSGLVNAGQWLPPDEIRARLGAAAEPLIAALKDAPRTVFDLIERHRIPCEATRAGTLWVALDAAGLRKAEARCAQVNADGARTRILDAEEARARLGSPAPSGALFDPDCGTIQPMAYARGLARAAQAAGAVLHSGSPVTAVERSGGRWTLTTPGGRLTADRAILGLNAYAEGAWPEIAAAHAPMRIFHVATEPLGAEGDAILAGGEGAWSSETVLSIWRRDAAGRLVLGSIGDGEGWSAAAHRAWILRKARRMFPQLGPLRIAHAWTGTVAVTSNALPGYHQLGPGLDTVAGWNGRGIGPGTVFGALLAERALGSNAPLPLAPTPLRAAPLRAARAAAFEAGAAAAHLIDARF